MIGRIRAKASVKNIETTKGRKSIANSEDEYCIGGGWESLGIRKVSKIQKEL